MTVRTMQTMSEIKAWADMAETYPESGELNWCEISFDALLDWVTHEKNSGSQDLFSLDLESVKGCFERWWKRQNIVANAEISGGYKPSAVLIC